MLQPANHQSEIVHYYTYFGPLFERLTDHSGYMNLGYVEKGQSHDTAALAQENLIRKVAAAGRFEPGMQVLDVGCGLGGPGTLVARECRCRVIGIDPGKYQRTRLRRSRTPEYGLPAFAPVAGDAMALPFRPSSMDRIYSIESAFHYPDKARFIREASRLLKADGILVIADILPRAKRNRSWLSARFQTALNAPQFFTRESYEQAAAAAGMQMLGFLDISDGVRRVMPIWRKLFFRHRRDLGQIYSRKTLTSIGAALSFASWFSGWIPLRYCLLTFGFETGEKRGESQP